MIGLCILDSCTERFWCYWKEACLRQTWRWEESRPDVFVSAKATGERQNSSCWAVYRHVVHTHTYTHTLWESVHAHNIIEEYFYLFIFFKQFLKQMLLLSLTVLPGSSARSDQIRSDKTRSGSERSYMLLKASEFSPTDLISSGHHNSALHRTHPIGPDLTSERSGWVTRCCC